MSHSLEEQLVQTLICQNRHIACAESCTGGLIAARIINVANASRVLDVSFITYANEAKINYLGVSPETIDRYNVVSEAVAAEMAAGVAKKAGCEIGIATTGLAGPGGGSEKIPVGTVCFGFSICGSVITSTMHFPGLSRNEVREKSTDYALMVLNSILLA